MPRLPRRWLIFAYGLLVPSLCASPVAARTVATAPAEDPHKRINDQIVQADAARRDGRLSDAARLYADAYRMTAAIEDYRASDVALDVALQAATVHREAFKASNEDYTFLRESRDLLRTVVGDWEAAGRPVPQAVLDELQWVDTQLAAAPEPVPEPTPTVEPEDAAADPPVPFEASLDPVPPKPPADGDSATPRRPPRALGIALVSGGAAATVAGAVLLALGAPLRGRAEQYRSEALDSPEYTERGSAQQAIIEEHFDGYVADERRRGVALMASGGALLGVGVAAVVVGSLRLVRSGRSPASGAASRRLSPRLAVYHGAATLEVSFEF
jgi:hypothetical protein